MLGSSSEAGTGEVLGEKIGGHLCTEAELRIERITIPQYRSYSVAFLPEQSCDMLAVVTLLSATTPTVEGEDVKTRTGPSAWPIFIFFF